MDIKIFAITTPGHQLLRECFEESFEDEFPMDIVEIEGEGEGNGDFGSVSWYNALLAKQRLVRAEIAKSRGGILIVSDIDIQFFGRIRPAIEALLHDEVDMLFQAEREPTNRQSLNAGFIVLRCNSLVENIYDELLRSDIKRLPLGEQTWFNSKLRCYSPRWALLPSIFYAWSQNPGKPPENILLHHANCTSGRNSVSAKLQQMLLIRKIVASRREARDSSR